MGWPNWNEHAANLQNHLSHPSFNILSRWGLYCLPGLVSKVPHAIGLDEMEGLFLPKWFSDSVLWGYFLNVTPRKRKMEKILRPAHENFQSETIPQDINHTIVQVPALSAPCCTSLRQAASKATSYFFSSAVFACLTPCPVLFLPPLAWNARYKIRRHGLQLHQLSFVSAGQHNTEKCQLTAFQYKDNGYKANSRLERGRAMCLLQQLLIR